MTASHSLRRQLSNAVPRLGIRRVAIPEDMDRNDNADLYGMSRSCAECAVDRHRGARLHPPSPPRARSRSGSPRRSRASGAAAAGLAAMRVAFRGVRHGHAGCFGNSAIRKNSGDRTVMSSRAPRLPLDVRTRAVTRACRLVEGVVEA